MKKKAINRSNLAQHLLEYELKIVGKTLPEILETDTWRFKWTITREQYYSFLDYSLFLIQKIFHVNHTKAMETFDFFYKLFGLRIKN